jgi:tetratricopeptide (TPR) repeat protein
VEVLRVAARALRHAGDLAAAEATLREAEQVAHDDAAARGAVVVDRGVLHHQRREVEAAEACYRQALALHRAAHDRAGEGRALGNLGALAHDLGRWDEARALYTEALEHVARADDVALGGRFWANLGVLELEVGRSPEARACFERANVALEQVGDRRLLAITRGNLGLLDHQDGRVDLARAHHETALAILDEVGEPRSIVLAAARLAGVEALSGDVEAARARLAEADLRALRLGDPVTAGVVALARGFLDVAEAHRAWGRGQIEPAKAHVERALARVAEARERPAGRPLVSQSDDARTAARLLEQAIAAAVPSVAPGPGRQLRVAPAALGFAAPGAAWQDFRRRQPLRRLLLELVEQRRRAPGKSVSAERLIEAAWPGERIQAEAATNRLYVALATLRKLGLKDVVLSRDEGYVIDPDVEIVWVEPGGGASVTQNTDVV